MGFLTAYDGTHRVAIPHPDPNVEYWVDLKKYLSHGATEKAALALQEMELHQGRPQPAPNVFKQQSELVFASILGWNLDDDNGTVWPINMQSIRRLPGEVFKLLHDEVEKLNGPRSPQEQAQFRAEDLGGDPVAGGGVDTAGAVDVPGAAGVLEAPGTEA